MRLPEPVLKFIRTASPRLFWPSLGVLVLSAILFGKLVYTFHLSAQEEAAIKAASLAAYRDMTARIEEIRRQKDDGKARLMEAEKRLISGGKTGSGVAVLQEAFRACSARNGISIASNRALPAVKEGSYLKIPMEFQFRADVLQLKELLSDMQTSPVLMGMKGVKIKSRGASEPGKLDVSMVVEAAMKPAALPD